MLQLQKTTAIQDPQFQFRASFAPKVVFLHRNVRKHVVMTLGRSYVSYAYGTLHVICRLRQLYYVQNGN